MESKIAEKSWSKEFEKAFYEKWKNNPLYAFRRNSDKPVYSIDTPPPYVNTPVHMGHAATYSIMDMIARFRRMMGYEVLFPLGLDRNGLPIEMAAEKKFKTKFNRVSREEFLLMCNKVLEESSAESVDSFMKLGIAFNSWNKGTGLGEIYETDSNDYRTLTQETFIDLYNQGLIYEDDRINNYCPGCMTTIADAEIDYKDIPSTFNDVVFTVKETGEKIIIGTTRPELIPSCGMVIFNPEDKRYQHLNGKTAVTPLFNTEVPIKAHPLAEIDKGTGLVMMCSAGDLSDIRFFREMGIAPIISISIDGTMNDNAGFLKGMKIKDAREKMIQDLKADNLLVKQVPVTHRTPICERSKHEIEFISMKEYYLKQVEFKDKMLALADKMNFYDESIKQIYLDWINSVSIDWPISRRRYYATEVPLWYCNGCGQVIVPPKGKYYKPWKEKPPVKECPECHSKEFTGDTRVLDTWFDSSNSPLYVLKYSRDKEFFEKNNRCSLRPQGKEIIRTWLYYTVFKDFLLTKKCIFKDVWIHHHIIDEKGIKMSKSLGNMIDPHDILEKFGAEPFRLWCAVEGDITKTDLRCSYERIEGAGKTLTKLWNVARFVSMFEDPSGDVKLSDTDKWVLNEINELVKLSRARYEKYDFHTPSLELRHFIWETFSSHYLELVKNRAYNDNKLFLKEEQNGALFTLHYCLETLLKLLAPIIPFATAKLYEEIKEKDIHSEEFPKVADNYEISFKKEDIVELNGAIWKAKKDAQISLKAPVKELILSHKLKGAEKDIMQAHSVEKIKFDDKVEVKV